MARSGACVELEASASVDINVMMYPRCTIDEEKLQICVQMREIVRLGMTVNSSVHVGDGNEEE